MSGVCVGGVANGEIVGMLTFHHEATQTCAARMKIISGTVESNVSKVTSNLLLPWMSRVCSAGVSLVPMASLKLWER